MAQSTRNRRKDIEETFAGAHRMVKGLELRSADEDPWAMAEMLTLAAELETAALHTCKRLREVGYTWTDIGQAMGISATTAIKRYAKKIDALAAEQTEDAA